MTLCSAGNSVACRQSYLDDYTDGSKELLSWNNMLESCKTLSGVEYQVKHLDTINGSI